MTLDGPDAIQDHNGTETEPQRIQNRLADAIFSRETTHEQAMYSPGTQLRFEAVDREFRVVVAIRIGCLVDDPDINWKFQPGRECSPW